MNSVSIALRRYREEHGLSEKQLGDLIGLGRDAVHSFEIGYNIPSLPTLRGLARLFTWTPEDVGAFVLSLPDKRAAPYGACGVVSRSLPVARECDLPSGHEGVHQSHGVGFYE